MGKPALTIVEIFLVNWSISLSGTFAQGPKLR
jgi:hypothetical protein